jgi:hypothetical protein
VDDSGDWVSLASCGMLSDGEQWRPSDVMDAEFAGVAASTCGGVAATERDLERAPGDGVGKSGVTP